MGTVKQTYVIGSSVEKVWQALVDPKIIALWTGEPAVMSEKVGDKFELWSGSIHGVNIEVVPPKLLSQDWFADKWEHPSHVTIVLSDVDNQAHVELSQTDIPDAEVGDISNGWKDYYFGPLKKLLETPTQK